MEERKVPFLKYMKSRERQLKKQAEHQWQKNKYNGTEWENKKNKWNSDS